MNRLKDNDRFGTGTINPYLNGLTLIGARLLWDLHWKSWASRQRLRRFRNSHYGKKAVILCNGPSLLKTKLDTLQDVFTIGLNKINLLFDKSSFRPSCIVAVNPLVIDQNLEFYSSTRIPLFISSIARHVLALRPNVSFLHSTNIPMFARDCSLSLYEGGTVTYIAMQLAFHLGFSHVALVGCDHNFNTKGPPHTTVVATESDKNHFDPNYFGKGIAWQLPDLAMSEMAYSLAREVYEEFGRKLVNCTVGGNLEILERVDLEDFMKS